MKEYYQSQALDQWEGSSQILIEQFSYYPTKRQQWGRFRFENIDKDLAPDHN